MIPKKWSFSVLKAARWASNPDPDTDQSQFEDWVLWVKASALPLDFPLDPNARHPDLESRAARAIAKTLREQPAEFIKRNNGICMVARSCTVRDGMAHVILDQVNEDEERDDGRRGDGILNGGHTYAVLRSALQQAGQASGDGAPDPNEAVVRLEVQTGLAEEDLADISRARNLSSPVAEYSLKNLGKSWETIKQALPKAMRARIAFMEGDPEAPSADYDVGDLVKLLALFNNRVYPAGKKDPVAAFTSEKSLINRWRPEDFSQLLPHLEQLVGLHDDLVEMFPRLMKSMGGKPGKLDGVEIAEQKQAFALMSGRTTKYRIPAAFLFPVLAAMRVFLSDDGNSWFVTPKDLVAAGGPAEVLMLDAMRHYKQNGRSNAAFFGRNRQVWELLCMRAQLLRQSLVA